MLVRDDVMRSTLFSFPRFVHQIIRRQRLKSREASYYNDVKRHKTVLNK